MKMKQHEIGCLDLLFSRFDQSEKFSVLDIGCADAGFLKFVKEAFQNTWCWVGHRPHFVEEAKSRNLDGFEFIEADMMESPKVGKFDLVIASGVLTIYDDIDAAVAWFASCLKKQGTLICFTRVNEANVDVRSYFKLVGNDVSSAEYEAGMNSYSKLSIFGSFEANGLKCDIVDFQLSIDLPATDDPVRSYTIQTKSGERIVANGANLIANQKFVIGTFENEILRYVCSAGYSSKPEF